VHGGVLLKTLDRVVFSAPHGKPTEVPDLEVRSEEDARRPCAEDIPRDQGLSSCETPARTSARWIGESQTGTLCVSPASPAGSFGGDVRSGADDTSRNVMGGASVPAIPGARPCHVGVTAPWVRCSAAASLAAGTAPTPEGRAAARHA
jgi:hypothetical protein